MVNGSWVKRSLWIALLASASLMVACGSDYLPAARSLTSLFARLFSLLLRLSTILLRVELPRETTAEVALGIERIQGVVMITSAVDSHPAARRRRSCR